MLIFKWSRGRPGVKVLQTFLAMARDVALASIRLAERKKATHRVAFLSGAGDGQA